MNRAALKSIAIQMNSIDSELAKLDEYRDNGKSLTSNDQDDAYRAMLLDRYNQLVSKKDSVCKKMFPKPAFITTILSKN